MCFSLVTVLKFLIFIAKFIHLLLTFNEAKSGSLEKRPMGLPIFSLKLQTQKIWKFKKKGGRGIKGRETYDRNFEGLLSIRKKEKEKLDNPESE